MEKRDSRDTRENRDDRKRDDRKRDKKGNFSIDFYFCQNWKKFDWKMTINFVEIFILNNSRVYVLFEF